MDNHIPIIGEIYQYGTTLYLITDANYVDETFQYFRLNVKNVKIVSNIRFSFLQKTVYTLIT